MNTFEKVFSDFYRELIHSGPQGRDLAVARYL